MTLLEHIEAPLSSMFHFPKHHRLLQRREFTSTMDAGIKIINSYLVVLGRPCQKSETRIGFIVSKKMGDAVTRNRVKRRLRELFRTLPQKPVGFDIVVIGRKPAVGADWKDLEAAFATALTRIESKVKKLPQA